MFTRLSSFWSCGVCKETREATFQYSFPAAVNRIQNLIIKRNAIQCNISIFLHNLLTANSNRMRLKAPKTQLSREHPTLHVLTPGGCELYARRKHNEVLLVQYQQPHETDNASILVDNNIRWATYHFCLFQKLLGRLGELILQQKRIHAFIEITRCRVLRRHLYHALSGRTGRKRNRHLWSCAQAHSDDVLSANCRWISLIHKLCSYKTKN